MTSYQRRKAELKELNAQRWEAEGEFTVLKHILLAIARGQVEHAKMTLKHFEKNHKIPECELAEIKALLERV